MSVIKPLYGAVMTFEEKIMKKILAKIKKDLDKQHKFNEKMLAKALQDIMLGKPRVFLGFYQYLKPKKK
jgi:hypothetical protein